MDFCKSYAFLRILPRPSRRIVWTWRTENGTDIRFTEHQPVEQCLVELVNICVPAIAILAALIVSLKYKCSDQPKDRRRLLPFHTIRTLLCISILLILFLELCESFLTSISFSSILTILSIFSCWILHRGTEIRDGLGTAFSAIIFAAVGLSRAWKFTYFSSYGLSIEHVRFTTTATVAVCCGLFAILDSYTFYLMTRRWRRRYLIGRREGDRTVYKHAEATFLDRITFHWVTELLSKGYSSPLDNQDLGQLPEDETTGRQFEIFRKIYEEHRETGEKLSLWRCFWKRIWRPFAVGGLLKLLGDATTLVAPMSITKILDYVSVTQNTTLHHEIFRGAMTFSDILQNGYFLGLMVFFFALLQSTLSQASTHILCVEGIRLKIALQALLYDKALRLCSWSIDEEESLLDKEKEPNKFQQSADIGTLTNLISEDVYNVMSFFWIGHYTWAIPLKVAAIVFLLYIKLGVSAIIGALCCILIVTPLQLVLGKKMSNNSKSVAVGQRFDSVPKIFYDPDMYRVLGKTIEIF